MSACAVCGAALPATARFCPACGAALEAEADERERKLVTVVFADLVGSTELGGSQDPERTRALLDRFYDAMAGEIDTAGGTVEKFAGDAVMAVFGAPAALEDHAERALHAGLAMQRRLRELFGETLALRIGVNTGEVVVGRPREGSSFVTGDAVNVAARLEQAAEPGEVLVGERTVATARGAFEFSELRSVEAKGKAGGVGCRRLVRALSLMRPRGVGDLRRAFVGRDDELRLLERVYAEVESSREPQLVTVLGDAGVGKTRLVREFWGHLAIRSPETLRRTGRCLSYGQGITYWPLGEVLKEHFALLDSDPPDIALERLGSREILGLTLGLDVAHGLHPLAARDRFQDAWVEFLEELVAERPAVVLVEDIHWAEEQLVDLLERLVRDTRGPLLLLTTARPDMLEQRPGWGARVPGEAVTLEALSAEDSLRMLDELLDGALPAGLAEVVVERAEGNPFFVEELLGTLIDRQLLERQDGSWRLAELPSDFSVPDTVHALVAARVDLLDAEEKQALQAASVIGRIFWAEPVYELVEEAAPDLRVLEERDFIRRRPGSAFAADREYAIKHSLTREVAYASLPIARRARMHAAFARWLERAGEGRDEYAPLLAHHYAVAVSPEDVDLAWAGDEGELEELRARAVVWLRRAAELAVGRFELEDGLALLQRAVELEADPSERAALWRELGHVNALKLDGEAFWTAMQKSLEAWSDRATAADTYGELAFHTAMRGAMWKRRPNDELVVGWSEQALELAEKETPARAKALIARAWLDPVGHGELARVADELAERLGDVELRSWAWEVRSVAAAARGDHAEAFAWTKRRFDLVPELSDPDHISLIYLYGLDPCLATGRLHEARRVAEAHDEVTRRLTPHHRVHAASMLVDVERAAGRWDAVRDLTARTETAVAENIATPCVMNVLSLFGCAVAHARQGDEREARRLEQSAEDLQLEYPVMQSVARVELALARGELGEVERMLGDWRRQRFRGALVQAARLDALVALERRAAIEQEAPILARAGTYLEPFALRALGFAREDEDLIRRAVERFEAMGLDWHAAQTRELLTRAS